MRHAHPEQILNKNDIERNITDLGRVQAIAAADFLADYKIDKIIISYATRALQTGEIICAKIPAAAVEIITELYHEKQEEVLEIFSNQENIHENILVIGHNPLIYNLALQLANNNSAQYEFLACSSMTPAQIIIIDFALLNDWQDLHGQHGDILEIFIPSESNLI